MRGTIETRIINENGELFFLSKSYTVQYHLLHWQLSDVTNPLCEHYHVDSMNININSRVDNNKIRMQPHHCSSTITWE